ncbi:hypothetical protein [Nocardia lasii]|uniref:Secreted protein n=1 Tax=Nocardia lasii TaxID=1616107 RepID=A0ABW1JY46_9NOCA
MSTSFAVRSAVVGAAAVIALSVSAGTAAALPVSGSAALATGSATGSAELASGSASSSVPAAGAYLSWQASQFISNTLRLLLSVPQRL